MASDGQVTAPSSGGPIRLEAPKIRRLGNLPILWGGATNDLGFIQKFDEAVKGALQLIKLGSLGELRPHLVAAMHELRRDVLTRHRELYGRDQEQVTARADLLFAEYGEGSGHLLSVGGDGGDVWLDDFGYGAVGVGDIFAHAALKGFNIRALPVSAVKLLACRVIVDAIEIGAFGMGPPIQIWVIQSQQRAATPTVLQVGKDELEALVDTARLFRQTEIDRFTEKALAQEANKAS